MFLQVLLFQFLNAFLHSVFLFFEFLYNSVVYLREKCSGPTIPKNGALHYIHREAKRIEKIPTHLTVLLGTEIPSYGDLANIVMWCMASGISFVSFYDYEGILKKTEDKLQQAVNGRKPEGYHVIWHSTEKNGYKNGYTGEKIHVRMLSPAEGRTSVVNTVHKFIKSDTKVEDIDIDNISNSVKDDYEFPNPEMGVCCGKGCSIYGYPPWQISCTEFFNTNTHHNINAQQFLKLLYAYSKCEQRFGK